EGEPASFDLIAVDPSGKRIEAQGVQWTLKKLTTNYQWFSTDRTLNSEPITTARKIAGGAIDIGGQDPAPLSMPVEWGEYRLEIAANGLKPASRTFSVGWYAVSKADTPDMLPV